jgi:hypothetical protein
MITLWGRSMSSSGLLSAGMTMIVHFNITNDPVFRSCHISGKTYHKDSTPYHQVAGVISLCGLLLQIYWHPLVRIIAIFALNSNNFELTLKTSSCSLKMANCDV